MAAGDRKLGQFIQDLLLVAAAPLLAYYLARQILTRLDPEAGAKAEAQQKAIAATSRLQSIFSTTKEKTMKTASIRTQNLKTRAETDDDSIDMRRKIGGKTWY